MLHSRNHSKCNLSVTEHGELIVLCGNEAKFCYVAVPFPLPLSHSASSVYRKGEEIKSRPVGLLWAGSRHRDVISI